MSRTTYVIVTGCFEFLHAGHIKILMQAKKIKELSNDKDIKLIALINSQKYLKKYKGRCLVPFELRVKALELLGFTVKKSDNHIKIFQKIQKYGTIIYVNAESKKYSDEVEWCLENKHAVILVKDEDIHCTEILEKYKQQ